MATYRCANHPCDHLFKNDKQTRWFDGLRGPVTDAFPCFDCQEELKQRATNLSSQLEKEKRVTEQLRKELKTERDETKQQLRKELKAEKKKAENFRLWAQTNQQYAENLRPLLNDNEATIETLSRMLKDEKQATEKLGKALDLARKDNKRLTAQLQLEREKQKTMDKKIEKLRNGILLEQTRAGNEIKLLKEKTRAIEKERQQAMRDADRHQEEARKASEDARIAYEEAKRAYDEAWNSKEREMEFRFGILRCAKSYERAVGCLPNDVQETVNKARRGSSHLGTKPIAHDQ